MYYDIRMLLQCTTCRKAKKWLEQRGVVFKERHIKENNPTIEELKEWHKKSGLPLKKFFNTSGRMYREMKLKDRLPTMSEDEQYKLLASVGMLVKRPFLIQSNPWQLFCYWVWAKGWQVFKSGYCFLPPIFSLAFTPILQEQCCKQYCIRPF